jgi:hypothetical protein
MSKNWSAGDYPAIEARGLVKVYDGLLAPAGLPRRTGALAAPATFGWRAMLEIKHESKQLTDVIAIPVVFTVLFTYILAAPSAARPATTSRRSCQARRSRASPPSACTAAPDSPKTSPRRQCRRLVPHRHRRNHPGVRATHPPSLRQAGRTRARSQPSREIKHLTA